MTRSAVAKGESRSRMGDSDLSIITTTRAHFAGPSPTLPVVLDELHRQSLPPGTEFIVVDDGGEPETRKYLDGAADGADDLDLVYVPVECDDNYSAALNRGVEHATGDVLLFIDNDTVPLGADSVRNAVVEWTPGSVLCGARQYWTPPNWRVESVSERLARREYGRLRDWAHLPVDALDRDTGRRSLQEFTFLSNFGIVARDALERVGRFDEDVPEWRGSDEAALERLLGDGLSFVNLFDHTEVLHFTHPTRSRRGPVSTNNAAAPGEEFDANRVFHAGPGTLPSRGPDDSSITVRTPERLPNPAVEKPRWRADAEAGTDRQNNVSVVIPTYNSFDERNGSLELLLRALERQRPGGFEVVVVDDGSTDRTSEFLASFAERTSLELHVVELASNTGNRALSRNRGAATATNDLLVFIDDDTIPLSDTAIATVAARTEPGTFSCGARRYWTSVNWDRERVAALITDGRYEKLETTGFLPRGINWRHGYRQLFDYTFIANLGAIDRAAFDAVGGFDGEELPNYEHEDVDLMYRLLLDGYEFVNLHDALGVLHLNHSIRPSDRQTAEASVDRFRERERERGYGFKVNHLFGVYENDGDAVLEPIDDDGPHRYD